MARLTPMRRRPVAFGPADRILVVGAGPAGISAAEELRRLEFQGQIMILCDDPHGPIDRPACSKGLITGHQRPQDAKLAVDERLELDWRIGRRAIACDLEERVVWAHTGEGFRFDGLVIASGSQPGLPKTWPRGPGLHIVSGIDDAWAIRRDLRRSRRITVVGGGLTGCEMSYGIRSMGRQATLIDPSPALMMRALDGPISAMMTAEHAAEGTYLRLGRRVKEVARLDEQWVLSLDDGDQIVSDMVIMTAGEKPDTAWLKDTGIDISNGVHCDEALRVLDEDGAVVPGVVAAGSLARWPNLWMSDEAKRCGQWIAALEQGVFAARTLLAGDAPAEAAVLLPRFWSLQLGLRVQVCGDVGPDTEIIRSDRRPGDRRPARSGVLACHYRGKDLVGAVAVNAPTEFTTVARSILANGPTRDITPLSVPRPVPARRRLAATG